MPIIKSAKKRVVQTAKRQDRNYTVRSKVHTVIKKIDTLVSGNKVEQAEKLLPSAYKEIDMAAKKNILHKNTADRKKARLARSIVKAKASSN